MSTPVVVVGADDYIAPFGAIRKVPGLKAYERACDRCGIRYRVLPPDGYARRGQVMPLLCRDCRPWLCKNGHDKDVFPPDPDGNCSECRRIRKRRAWHRDKQREAA